MTIGDHSSIGAKRGKRGGVKPKRIYIHFSNTESSKYALLPSFTVVTTITTPDHTTGKNHVNHAVPHHNTPVNGSKQVPDLRF